MRNRESVRKSSLTIGSAGKGSRFAFIGVIGFLILWSVISYLKFVNPLILPSPFRVIGAVKDVGYILLIHIFATTLRVMLGLFLGSAMGIFLGSCMQYNRVIFIGLDGLIETFRPIPPVALVPFFILIFGFSELGKILIVTLGVSLIMVVSMVEAIERVPVGVMRWGLVCGLSRFSLFRYVILPSAWPEMRVGFRIAMALAFTLVIVSEFMGATYGLGYLLNRSKITLTTPTIFLCVIILGWLGWLFDRGLRYVFDRTCFWDIRAKEAIR